MDIHMVVLKSCERTQEEIGTQLLWINENIYRNQNNAT